MNKELKRIRYEKGYTTAEMANMLDISKAFYCQIENSKRRLSYEMAIKIADIFRLKPDQVFYNDFAKKEK